MGAGHASTLDRLRGRPQGGDARSGIAEDGVIAVIGDGAMTGGVAYEAMICRRRLPDPDGDSAQRQRHVDLAKRRALSSYFPAARLNPEVPTTRERSRIA